MKLGFSVEELLGQARAGGALRMGLRAIAEPDWLQPEPDLTARAAAFAAASDSVQTTAAAQAPVRELARLRKTDSDLATIACGQWEDVCLLERDGETGPYRLTAAAVAFPTDWHPAEKLGLPLTALHAPIHGYAEQLATGVDHFMAALQPGKIFGRANWFVSETRALRWIAQPAERAFTYVTAENAGENLFVRCERQTLRKLPETGAVVFTIGAYVAPLGSLSAANVARLSHAVATLPAPEAKRRGAAYFAPALQAYAARHDAAIDCAA